MPPAIPTSGRAGPGRPGGPYPPSGRHDRADEFEAILHEPVPLARRQVNATPIVLAIVGILVVVGLVWAWQSLTAPAPPIGGEEGLDLTETTDTGDTGDDPAGEGEAEGDGGDTEGEAQPPPEDTEPSTGPPVVASAQMLDPPPDGDNNEHPEAVDRAIDGDPTTYWFTRTYASPTYGMKDGVGYAVTLQESATVSSVRLLVNGTGGMVEVRATDPATPTQGPVLASGALGPETVLTLSEPTTTQHVVLWFTALPQTPDGRNRVELLELEIS